MGAAVFTIQGNPDFKAVCVQNGTHPLDHRRYRSCGLAPCRAALEKAGTASKREAEEIRADNTMNYELGQDISTGVSAAGKSVPGAEAAGLPLAIAELVFTGIESGIAIAESYRQLKAIRNSTRDEREALEAVKRMKQLELQAKAILKKRKEKEYTGMGKAGKTIAIVGAATAGALALFTN